MLMTTMKLKDSINKSKIIIWGHNNHICDATATENGGTNLINNNNWNLGQMCRSMFQNTYIIGLGTYNGSLIATHELNKKYSIYILNLPLEDSIEQYIYMFCKLRNINNCYIDLNLCKNISPFNQKKKQRTIGLIYNPINEINYHYISSILSKQFDLYIFISYTTHLIKTTKKKYNNNNNNNYTIDINSIDINSIDNLT
jgi:protein-L-isoaspartate(D-aspartate) O-methyltransferase